MNDVTIGSWRGGLDTQTARDVAAVEQRRDQGHRLLPYESTVSELALLLDGYDAFAQEILTEDCKCGEPVPVGGPDPEPLLAMETIEQGFAPIPAKAPRKK